ncbi:cytochrome-c peroxidase, partial [Rhodopirellula bahusiensis]
MLRFNDAFPNTLNFTMTIHRFLMCAAATLVAATPTAFAAETVSLGDPTLTSGIPGDGPLTLEQAQRFMANPDNHAELNVELPKGLDAASGNIYIPEDNPITRAKIELGRQLYFDPRLSADGTISCATCHAAETGWGAPTQFGVGIGGQTGNRNSPVSFNRIL